jgi:hypothetical protein
MHFEIDNREEALRRWAEMTDCEKAEMVKELRRAIDNIGKKAKLTDNKDN